MSKFRVKLLIFSVFSVLILPSCFSPPEPPVPTATFAPPTPVPTQGVSESVAVILLEEGEELNIHVSANEESAMIESVPANTVGIPRTGREEFSNDEIWVEIQASTGEAGWGQGRFLTEYVPNEIFCADSRIPFLLEEFKIALKNKDSDLQPNSQGWRYLWLQSFISYTAKYGKCQSRLY